MTVILVSPTFARAYGDQLRAAAAEVDFDYELLLLPEDPAARLSAEECARVGIAYFSEDMILEHTRSFFAATQGAPNLQWCHVFNAGVDNPVFRRLLDSGARITTSSGATAKPIAQSVIGSMIMLARGFLPWLEAQRRHAWERNLDAQPPDLDGQTMLVYGVGAIGNEIARMAQAIGLHVIGVRRSPRNPGDHVDEMHPPSALMDLLPRAQWLALACPLTDETRGVIGEAPLARLPAGARLLNIARGEVVDEPALIRALQSGHLGGAYLDVFYQEPLPPESPFWDMPNVIITPHCSAVVSGNRHRQTGFFLRNLRAWARGEPLENEVGT